MIDIWVDFIFQFHIHITRRYYELYKTDRFLKIVTLILQDCDNRTNCF